MADIARLRRVNFFTILHELYAEGVHSVREQAAALGVSERVLDAILRGRFIEDDLAREIEWAVHKPDRWMDADHELGSF